MSYLASDVYETIQRYHMLDPARETVVLVGLSGGADSVCLLAVLRELTMDGRIHARIRAVHVHHELRGGTADEDAAFVKRLCADWNIPLEVRHVNVLSYAKAHRMGTEEAGHVLRAQIFARICEASGEPVICTALAHHLEDQVETQLFHLARGCDIRGLAGILPVSSNIEDGSDQIFPMPKRIIRPLIRNTREEIEAYLHDKHISWRTDESNSDLDYKRNLIRHKILPEMKKVNQAFLCHCGTLSETAVDTERYLAEQTDQAWQRCATPTLAVSDRIDDRAGEDGSFHEDNRCVRLHLTVFDEEDPLIQRRLCYQALSFCAHRRKDITEDHVEILLSLAQKRGNGRADLCYDISALRQYEWLWIGPSAMEQEAALHLREVTEPDTFSYPLQGRDYAVCTFPYNRNPDKIPRNMCTKWFDYDKILLPVVFRTREKGDVLTISTDGRHKALARYMIDEKIPEGYRSRIVMPFSGKEVLWVPGGRISSRYLVDDSTSTILEIKLLMERKV